MDRDLPLETYHRASGAGAHQIVRVTREGALGVFESTEQNPKTTHVVREGTAHTAEA